jgi:AmmeMemoRadiSam system protein A
MLSLESKRELVRIARETIAGALGLRPVVETGTSDASLSAPRGAFVTLRIDSNLRGCIGYIESVLPLAEVVAEVALKAAFEDPRFPPLTRSEFDKISIEVSILSPLERVRDTEEIQVGVHGLLMELGSRRGLLLPQVATEYHWDRMTFLNSTARKAGLPENAWRSPDARIYKFSAEIVDEADLT